jgi:hypothetical protein
MILVDALNLIHGVPRLRRLMRERGLGAAELELIDVCSRVSRLGASAEIVLVFDGNRPAGAPTTPPAPGLCTRYVPDADADLLELLERRGDHLLVSADNELLARAIRSETPRSWFQGLEDLLSANAEFAQKSHLPDAAEVDDWLEAFGERPKSKAKPPKPSGGLPPDQVEGWLRYFGEA